MLVWNGMSIQSIGNHSKYLILEQSYLFRKKKKTQNLLTNNRSPALHYQKQ